MINITPSPGWLLCIPYLIPDSLFTSVREVSGETMKSEVLLVGAPLTDDNGIERTVDCVPGDIILHSYISEDFNIGTTKYRFVHFSNLRGNWNDAPKIKEKK